MVLSLVFYYNKINVNFIVMMVRMQKFTRYGSQFQFFVTSEKICSSKVFIFQTAHVTVMLCKHTHTFLDSRRLRHSNRGETVSTDEINVFFSVSILFAGRNVTIPGEIIVLNSIVLPHKDLSQSYKNEIIL